MGFTCPRKLPGMGEPLLLLSATPKSCGSWRSCGSSCPSLLQVGSPGTPHLPHRGASGPTWDPKGEWEKEGNPTGFWGCQVLTQCLPWGEGPSWPG